MNIHYLPEATFLLSFGMSMITLYKISKVAKLEKDDAEIIKVLKHYENANFFAVLAYMLIAGVFYTLYFLTGFNSVVTVVISGIISVLCANMIDDTKEITNMYHDYKESQE